MLTYYTGKNISIQIEFFPFLPPSLLPSLLSLSPSPPSFLPSLPSSFFNQRNCFPAPLLMLPLCLYLPETLREAVSCLPLISKDLLKNFDIIIFHVYHREFFRTTALLYVYVKLSAHLKHGLCSPGLLYFSSMSCLAC